MLIAENNGVIVLAESYIARQGNNEVEGPGLAITQASAQGIVVVMRATVIGVIVQVQSDLHIHWVTVVGGCDRYYDGVARIEGGTWYTIFV